jgi:hypothetical protein
MNRQIVQLLAGIIGTAFLAACGGGGGSSSGGGGGSTPATKKASTVSGTVALVSLSSLVAKRAQKVSVRKAAGQDAAQISIRSYDKKDLELGKYNLTTGTTGAFSQDVALSDGGGYVIITATKPGYADFSKRVDYVTPSALNLRAELAKATTGTGTAVGTTIDIGVVRNIATGAKAVYSGAALKSARKAAGNQVELDMKLNTAAIGGATSVIGQFETFNATDPTQAQYFPGAYRGTDTTAGKTGQLVSMAFDYINLTTNQGKDVFKEVKKLAKSGKKSAAASVVEKVTRWVPTTSCENLFLQDGKTGNGSWDVPIWSVDPYAGDGTWLKIGDGVVVTYNAISGLYEPVAVSDTSSSTAISAAKAACKSSGYYVEISITNPLYLEKWWNLDHIILSAAAPKDVCVSGKLVDQDNKPLTDIWMYMYDEDYSYTTNGTATLLSGEDGAQSFDYGYGVTNSTGAFTLKSALFNNSDTDRTATISYYDPVTYDYKEKIVNVGLFDTTKNSCPSTTTITVTRPAVCTVNGSLSGASSTGELITFYNGGNDYFYSYTYAETNGSFTAEVPCNRDLELYVGYNWSSSALFNVNGALGSFESKDTGSAAGSSVTLKPIIKANTPPDIWGYLDTYYAVTGSPVSTAVYAWDADDNYPLNYSITYANASGKQVQLISGTISKAQADSGNTINVALPTSLTAGSYNLNISATDSTGNSSAESPLGTLLVYDGGAGGFVPSVWLYADQYTINSTDLGTALSIPLYAYASDLDGAATLTYSWKVKYNGDDVTAAVGSALAFNPATDIYNWYTDSYATATFTPPKTISTTPTATSVGDGGLFSIEVSVSDGANSSSQAIDLQVGSVVTYPGTITIQKPALFKKR